MNAQTLERIDLDAIKPNADQPRKSFDSVKLKELAASILAAGKLHQPITVRPVSPEGTFEIVAGERRFRAHRLLVEQGHNQFATIVCHVEAMSEEAQDIAAIVENLQRCDVDAIEEATSLQRLVDHGQEIEHIAKMIGLEPWRVREKLTIMQLDPQVRHLIKSGQIAPTCSVALAKLNHRQQCEVVMKIASGKIAPTWNEISAAVQVVEEREAQGDMLSATPSASPEEMHTLNKMERQILSIKRLTAAGFENGECTIARKINPDRARKMAQELDLIRSAVGRMSRDLKVAAVQAELIA